VASSATKAAAPRRYDELDVLRGLAAFWVVLSHYLPHWDMYLGPAFIIVPQSWGINAVKLFFVISGFVIFMTLERCTTVSDFAVLRFSRLYPTYWATLIIATVLSTVLFGHKIWLHGLAANLTMFQEFLGYGNFDNVYWSLSVELAFYLNVAWLFALGLHRRTQLVVAAWLLLAWVWVLSGHHPQVDQRGWVAMLFALDYSPYFAMGIVFYAITRDGWSVPRASLIAFALGTELLLRGWSGLGIAFVVAFLFLLALHGHLKILVSRPTLWLGAISYSLYLIHRNLGYLTLDWLHASGIGPGLAVPAVIAMALTLATGVTYLVERPSIRWVRAFYDTWKVRRLR
jgi:peptidoglycan/LPS O-acetylase OafA/YrhL